MLPTHVHVFVGVGGAGGVQNDRQTGTTAAGMVAKTSPSYYSMTNTNISHPESKEDCEGSLIAERRMLVRHTDALFLIPILIHPSIGIHFPCQHKLKEFAPTCGWSRFRTEDAVEVAVKDAGVGRGVTEEDKRISMGHEVRENNGLEEWLEYVSAKMQCQGPWWSELPPRILVLAEIM